MKPMKTLFSALALLALPLFLACGGGGGGSSQPPQPTVIFVSLAPTTASLTAGATQAFTATVTGSSNTAVTWSVQEGTAGGTITAAGLYTAPATGGTFHVVATSVADASKSSMATVTVTVPVVAVTINPTTASLSTGGTQAFTATVTGSSNTAVTWSVQEGASGGTISAAGLYTAPATASIYHVVATSVADTSKSAVATVTVTAVVPTATSLVYTSPTTGPYLLVKDVASTGTHLVLDLIGPTSGTAMGISLTLTGDAHTTWTNVSASDPANTLVQNGTQFNLGSGTPMLKARVTGNVLQATVAQKSSIATSVNGILLKVALDLKSGQNLPQGTALVLTADSVKCQVLTATGTPDTSDPSTIAVSVGTLTAQ